MLDRGAIFELYPNGFGGEGNALMAGAALIRGSEFMSVQEPGDLGGEFLAAAM